jgi:hypothetical protein
MKAFVKRGDCQRYLGSLQKPRSEGPSESSCQKSFSIEYLINNSIAQLGAKYL